MEGQGKRLLIAVALALGVMLIWNQLFPSKDEPKPKQTTTATGSAAPTQSVAHTGVAYGPSAGAEAPRGPEAKETFTFPELTATFSNYGGTLVGWKLSDKRFEKDATHGQLLPEQPDTGAFAVGFWQGSTKLLPQKTEWKVAGKTDKTIRYTLSTPDLDLEKTFTIVPDAYIVTMALKVTAKVPAGQVAQQTLAISSFAFQDPKVSTKSSMQVQARIWNSSTLRDGEILHTPPSSFKGEPRYEKNITWTGFEHPYLLAAYAPKHESTELVWKATYPLEPAGLLRTDIVFPPANLSGGAPVTREVVAYLGPKNYSQLEHADGVAQYPTGFKQTIDLGWFAFIGRPLLWLLLQFHSVVGNWGIAIILLTFLVKGLTLYWTTKSMRSMKAMAALAPQMKALQEKYKDDRQRAQAETMALYKQHNVNPIAGCLPILLQMPVWLALYRMLSSAGELYQQAFIPGWIDDLTATDPFYILPVVLVVTMFVQARLSPQTGDSRQQKFLQYGMPLMFGVMSFFFPAGLTLYIFTNTVLSALHSLYMNKYDKKSLEIAARLKANQAAVAADKAKAANPGATPAKKNDAKPAAKKPVIDATSVEKTSGDEDDDSTEGAATPSSSSPAQARNRPRRKKKRR
ncbi:MAG TPA: membrane protein insertase YidC [Kofleriaceae bacterium]|nr:membrane protein insertase YidC [Kofleriaceae bacterium]